MTCGAAAAILEGMPEPKDLHALHSGGMTSLLAGPVALASWRDGDIAMRNIAVAVARQLGFPGKTVAAVLGLSENYVATLRQRALREGAGSVVHRGSRHKSGGWRLLTTPPGDAEGGCGAPEWATGVGGAAGRVRGRAAAGGASPGKRAGSMRSTRRSWCSADSRARPPGARRHRGPGRPAEPLGGVGRAAGPHNRRQMGPQQTRRSPRPLQRACLAPARP